MIHNSLVVRQLGTLDLSEYCSHICTNPESYGTEQSCFFLRLLWLAAVGSVFSVKRRQARGADHHLSSALLAAACSKGESRITLLVHQCLPRCKIFLDTNSAKWCSVLECTSAPAAEGLKRRKLAGRAVCSSKGGTSANPGKQIFSLVKWQLLEA